MKQLPRLSILLFCIAVISNPCLARTSLRPVVMVGQQVPGMPDGTTFSGFGTSAINANGKVAFRAGFNEPNSGSIWVEDGLGGLEMVVRVGDRAPQLPNSGFGHLFGEVYLSDDDAVTFTGQVGSWGRERLGQTGERGINPTSRFWGATSRSSERSGDR